MAVACLWVGFIPPAQANQPAAGDVFEVVEIGGKEKDGDDEDQNKVGCEEDAEEID